MQIDWVMLFIVVDSGRRRRAVYDASLYHMLRHDRRPKDRGVWTVDQWTIRKHSKSSYLRRGCPEKFLQSFGASLIHSMVWTLSDIYHDTEIQFREINDKPRVTG